MSGAMIRAQAEDCALVQRLTRKARAIAHAHRDRRWTSPRALWPLFSGDL